MYHLLWDITGETDPAEQVLGFGQYLMRFTRRQPDTEPHRPHAARADVSPYGVNTFLEQEVLPERRERQVQMIADAGFTWIRQQFPWEDIEIGAKGNFVDQRHDRNGDGVIDAADAISAWDKYDNIVDLAEQYGLADHRAAEPAAALEPAARHHQPHDAARRFAGFRRLRRGGGASVTRAASTTIRCGTSRTCTPNGATRRSTRKPTPTCCAAPITR